MDFLTDDSEQKTLNTLLRAFNLSWNYLDSHAVQLFVSAETAREFLKLTIVDLAQSGERNPVRMADLAIVQMRKLGRESAVLNNGAARVRVQESSDDGVKPASDDIVMLARARDFANRRSPNLSAQRDLHFWNSTSG